jgi:hypothetical protein
MQITLSVPPKHRDNELRRLEPPRSIAHLRITSTDPKSVRVQLFRIGGSCPSGWRQSLGPRDSVEVWPDELIGFVLENTGTEEQMVTVVLS